MLFFVIPRVWTMEIEKLDLRKVRRLPAGAIHFFGTLLFGFWLFQTFVNVGATRPRFMKFSKGMSC